MRSRFKGRNERPSPTRQYHYKTNPDSLPQEGVPKGKLEGPMLFRSQIFSNTVRRYWVYVPAQYTPEKPAACWYSRTANERRGQTGPLQLPRVMENLIAKKEMPVTIGIFITPGALGEEYVEARNGNPNNRSVEYDSLGDKYSRFILEEMLPEVGKSYNLRRTRRAGRSVGRAAGDLRIHGRLGAARPIPQGDQLHWKFYRYQGRACLSAAHPGQPKRKPIRIFLEDTLDDLPNAANPKRDWHLQNKAMVAAFQERATT